MCVSGNLAVISAGWENTDKANKAGAVYVYDFNGEEWVQKQRITNPEGSYDAIFGKSVCTNGEYIVITEPNKRSAHIYKYSNETWILDKKFTVTDVASEKYGISCAIDGSTILIGSGSVFAGYCTAVGSAYVYELNGTEWSLDTILIPSDPMPHDGFASCLDIEGDKIVVGAPRAHCYVGNEGYICTYERSGSIWEETRRCLHPIQW